MQSYSIYYNYENDVMTGEAFFVVVFLGVPTNFFFCFSFFEELATLSEWRHPHFDDGVGWGSVGGRHPCCLANGGRPLANFPDWLAPEEEDHQIAH